MELGMIKQNIRKKNRSKRRKGMRQTKDKASASPAASNNSKDLIFPGRMSKFGNLNISQEDSNKVQNTDTLNSVSEGDADSGISDYSSSCSDDSEENSPNKIDDLLDELRNKKEADTKAESSKQMSFKNFLQTNFHYKVNLSKKNKVCAAYFNFLVQKKKSGQYLC